MIAFTLTLLFAAATVIALASLADSAVRLRNAWSSIRSEMAFEDFTEQTAISAKVVAFRDIQPVRVAAVKPIQPLFNQPFASAA
jgi:hypothetical protein